MLSEDARTLAATIHHVIATGRAVGITQRVLAKKINKSHSTLSHWANGDRMPHAENLAQLCDALEVGEPLRDELFRLHHNANGAGAPDYVATAQYLTGCTGLASRDVARVLHALARCADVTSSMCRTTLDVSDLRGIANACTH